jgi:hypothetical protein
MLIIIIIIIMVTKYVEQKTSKRDLCTVLLLKRKQLTCPAFVEPPYARASSRGKNRLCKKHEFSSLHDLFFL